MIIPPPSTQNPGRGTTFSVAFSRDDASWEEQLDLPLLLQEALGGCGYEGELRDGWLVLPSGLALLPQFLDFTLSEDGTAQTSTTIEARDVEGSFSGLFEYQHSRSTESVRHSVYQGFERWASVDLVVLEDALAEAPGHCSVMKMSFSDEADSPERQVLLGPVAHYASQEAAEAGEAHPFCPCCLFSNSMEGFMDLLRAPEVYAVRMYAARSSEGEIMADCRVNGEDFEAGRQALLLYAAQWPQRGLEYRKQMILIR